MQNHDLALDRERLPDAVKRTAARLGTLDESYAASPEWLNEQVLGALPASWIDLLRLRARGEAIDNFALLLIAADTLMQRRVVAHGFEDLLVVEETVIRVVGALRRSIEQVPRIRVHHGDVRVSGPFIFQDPVLITGDLEVEGAICAAGHELPLQVAGNLRASALCSGSPLVVGGDLDVENVVLADYHAEIHVLGALRTPWLVESPLGGEVVGDTPHVGRRLAGDRAEDPKALAELAAALGVETKEGAGEIVSSFINGLDDRTQPAP